MFLFFQYSWAVYSKDRSKEQINISSKIKLLSNLSKILLKITWEGVYLISTVITYRGHGCTPSLVPNILNLCLNTEEKGLFYWTSAHLSAFRIYCAAFGCKSTYRFKSAVNKTAKLKYMEKKKEKQANRNPANKAFFQSIENLCKVFYSIVVFLCLHGGVSLLWKLFL